MDSVKNIKRKIETIESELNTLRSDLENAEDRNNPSLAQSIRTKIMNLIKTQESLVNSLPVDPEKAKKYFDDMRASI